MHFPCNLLVEDYTEVFYMIHKGDIPSVQRENNLRWSKPMREVDGLGFIFIYFNISALAQLLN
jgi:hypothetical protein